MEFQEERNSEIRWIPDGFHFYEPEKSKLRRKIQNQITEFFEKTGYNEVFLPAYDYSATFTGHLANQEKNSVIKSRDFAGSEISPSSDLTIQAVKGLAGNYTDQIQKIFYTSSVIRDNDRHNGRRRETLQAGAEVIGSSDISTIQSLIAEISSILTVFGVKDSFVLVLGNTEIFKSITEHLKLSGTEVSFLSGLLYAKDWTGVKKFLTARQADKSTVQLIKSLLFDYEFSLVVEKLENSGLNNTKRITKETGDIISQNKRKPESALNLIPDFSMIRDLDYYTGYIFHGYLKGYSEPLITGGVYNHLFEKFSDRARDACGFAVNLDLLQEYLEKKQGD